MLTTGKALREVAPEQDAAPSNDGTVAEGDTTTNFDLESAPSSLLERRPSNTEASTPPF